MLASIRPYATAGVALVGASVIAVAPVVAPPIPDLTVPATVASPVELTVSPIDWYAEVFERTFGNATGLVELFLDAPAPILSQIIANQIANAETLVDAFQTAATAIGEALTTTVPEMIQDAFASLTEGDVSGFVNTLLELPLAVGLPLVNILGAVVTGFMSTVDNFNNVVQEVLGGAILGGLLAVAGPVISTVGAMGTVVQNVIDAVGTADPIEVVNAIVNAPGVIADGFLNGGYGPLFLGALPAPGLLSPGLLGPLGGGPIDFVMQIRRAIAQAIGWTPPAVLATATDVDQLEGLKEDASVQKTTEAFEANQVSYSPGSTVDLSLKENGSAEGAPPAGEVENETPDAGKTLKGKGLKTLSGNTTGYTKNSLTATPGGIGLSGGTNNGDKDVEDTETKNGGDAELGASGGQNAGGGAGAGAGNTGDTGDNGDNGDAGSDDGGSESGGGDE